MNTTQQSQTRDLDALIESVARGMTAAEPSTDLRARVLNRLDDRPTRSMWRWMPLLTLAASTVIVVGTWALWPRATHGLAEPRTTIARVEPVHVPVVSPARNNVMPVVRMRRVINARPAAEMMSEAELAWNARAVPALSGPSALAIAPLEQSGVTIAPIEIQPLVTEPLLIKSLINSTGDRRDILK